MGDSSIPLPLKKSHVKQAPNLTLLIHSDTWLIFFLVLLAEIFMSEKKAVIESEIDPFSQSMS